EPSYFTTRVTSAWRPTSNVVAPKETLSSPAPEIVTVTGSSERVSGSMVINVASGMEVHAWAATRSEGAPAARKRSLEPSTVSTLTPRSEEHTSELKSRFDRVCRLLLEKKKK